MNRHVAHGFVVCALVVASACDGSDESSSATDPPIDTAPTAPTDPTTTVAPTAPAPEPTTTPAPPPPTEPESAPTTEAPFEPPAMITLDDGVLAMEPPDTSYRATLLFSMTATLADGTVQQGIAIGDGGKIIGDDGTISHSFVIDADGLIDLPDCLDLAALDPGWISVYDTFYGDDAGDIAGDAALSEAGIMTNGLLVDRYEITLDNIDPEESNDYETLTEAYVDVARDGGHLVRLVLSGTGFDNAFTVDQSEARDIVFELDFLEHDTITEFTVPEGCLPPE